MAIQLSANYSKKLGLPGYSSHSFSASVEVELTDLSQVEAEVQKLYQLLQHSVDQEIQHPGFVPGDAPATNGQAPAQASNGHSYLVQRNGRHPNGSRPNGDTWNCTDGQRSFILRLIHDQNLEKQQVEELSQQLYGTGVRQLNKLQASQLIEELLAKTGKTPRRWQPQRTAA
jgi:hypothetical protein